MMKKIFTKGFIAVAMVAVVGFVSSCKDYNDEIMAEYRGEDAKLKQWIADLLTKHNEDLAAAKDARDEMKKELEDLIDEVEEKQDIRNQAQSDSIKWAVDSIGKLDARIVALEKRVSAIDSIGGRLDVLEEINAGQRLDDIEKLLGALETAVGDSTAIATWSSDLKDLKDDVATAKGNHANLTERLSSMQQSIDDIKSCGVDCEALDSLVKEMGEDIDSIFNVVDTVRLSLNSLSLDVDTLIDRVDGLDTTVYNLDEAIKSIEIAYQKADSMLLDSIKVLRNDLTELEKRVAQNEADIDSIFGEIKVLKEDVEDLKDGMKNRISSVLVQGAYSPVVGYFNIPFGIKSNILAAYKGEVIESMNFPFAYSESMYDKNVNPLEALKASLGYEGETISELGDGYAGKLYLTINPAEVDLDSVDFALVNSQNELAPIALDSVIVSSDVLKFGYTRAGGAALYEAAATITDMDAASLDLNFGGYKDILSDLKNGSVNLTDIASTLYSSINDIAEANAVRASWTDSLGEHSVYSDFAVAAVAVKPLAFTFLQDLNLQSVPGITRVQNFIDKAFDKVNIALPSFDGLNFTAPEITKIAIKDFDELGVNTVVTIKDTVEYTLNMEVPVEDVVMNNLTGTTDKITVTVPEKTHDVVIDGNPGSILIPAYTIEVPASNFTVDGPTVKIQNVKINKVLEIPFTVKYDMKDIVEDLYGSVTKPIEDVNKMLGDLEDFMDDVNGMLDELKKVQDLEQSITDAMDGIKSQLNSYLDKLNDKLCNAINSLNDKLQPAMFVKTTSGFGMLSQSKNMPTVIENGAVLVPTTYTAELLAPASKKYVAITAVDGSTDNLAAANTGDLNKVLEGSVRAVEFNGEAGKTYELTYAALDYAGNVSTVKYYVTVK